MVTTRFSGLGSYCKACSSYVPRDCPKDGSCAQNANPNRLAELRPMKSQEPAWAQWIALGVFVAMALTAVFGWCA